MRKIAPFLMLFTAILFIKCGSTNDEVIIEGKPFGKIGTHRTATYTAGNYAYSTIYYPADIASLDKKAPLLFFASGWFGNPETSSKYETLLKFISSHGYVVIYTDEGSTTDTQHSIDAYKNILSNRFFVDNLLQYTDTDKMGVIGHSAGGGIAFKILDYFSNTESYGTNGRFIMTLDPWFAFDMSAENMQSLPSNTNVVFIKFGEGGNNTADGTDARIPLTEYSLLTSIANPKKDYQVYDLEDADHNYPTGNRPVEEMQGILRPLDALMEYTFIEQSESTRVVALENGNDDPYANGNGIQVVNTTYVYPCDGANTLIDYCAIIP